jgi:NADH-quinone oxidoreductase subunit A
MSYIPVLTMLIIAAVLGTVIVIASGLLGPKVVNPRKNLPFECGMPPVGDARRRFSVRFYLVAILFLLFDVEGVFFFPWAISFKDFLAVNSFILLEMGFFVGVLLLGYFYVLRKGALEWE